MYLSDLLFALIATAEKGNKVARIIRAEDSLLRLLVQEKEAKEKNDRFVQDFKTLTDVLIQEMVRHDLSLKFAGIENGVYGEESNHFTNQQGKSVIVKLGSSSQETKHMLSQVLDGNDEAANILTNVLHEDVVPSENLHLSPQLQEDLSVEDVGIWIDPIDSTFQYISGRNGLTKEAGLVEEGLQCVTLLIGAFHRQTGQVIVGVCGQPFKQFDAALHKWDQGLTWGVCYKDLRLSSLNCSTPTPNHSIVISASESDHIRKRLSKRFTVYNASGAGYKILSVCWGTVDAYLLSKPTIYKWDCCGPHGVLRALGGDIVAFENQSSDKGRQLMYTFSSTGNNFPGIIAYRNDSVLSEILECLKVET